MRLALLMGNRFNPWHLQGFARLRGNPDITAFRAESQIQEYFRDRGDGHLPMNEERIYFDTQAGNPIQRIGNVLRERYAERAPRIVPFHDRLLGYELIQTWELFTDWTREALEARARYGTPVSIMVWDNIPFHMDDDAERAAIKQRAIREADRFIVYTERSRRTLLMEGVNRDRISTMLPGVDTARFSPGASDRESLGLANDAFVIAFVGWLVPRKGIDFLLMALHELLRDDTARNRRIQLLIVGTGAGRDRVDALIHRLNLKQHCVIVDSRSYDEMPNVYRCADVYVQPSIATEHWQEQFGMSIIEAMACGVPVIASRSGAIEEIVEGAGQLCQPNDFLALYLALKDLLLSEPHRRESGQRARTHAVKRFDLDAHANALSDLYAAMLSEYDARVRPVA